MIRKISRLLSATVLAISVGCYNDYGRPLSPDATVIATPPVRPQEASPALPLAPLPVLVDKPLESATEASGICIALPTTTNFNSVDIYSNTVFDKEIQRWVAHYQLPVPWWWVKAVLIQESWLNPSAVSWMGAMGIGQFMPNTWVWVEGRIWNTPTNIYFAENNIQASVYYLKWLWEQFKSPRPVEDRWGLVLSSYNAGLGNVLKAQKVGGGSLLYQPMRESLISVTGKDNSKQTRDYVDNIWKHIRKLEEIYE